MLEAIETSPNGCLVDLFQPDHPLSRYSRNQALRIEVEIAIGRERGIHQRPETQSTAIFSSVHSDWSLGLPVAREP